MSAHRIEVRANLEAAVEAAVHELQSGGIVAVPTDTTYALVADDSHTGAADRLFKLTKRQRTFELTLLVADQTQVQSVALGITPQAQRLMDKCWPGALSLVLPRNPDFVADLGSDDETVGVRCPDHLPARLVCERLGPLASASAGLHGEPAVNSADEVDALFGDQVTLIVDGGPTPDAAATVVDATGSEPKLLREGSVSWNDITSVLD